MKMNTGRFKPIEFVEAIGDEPEKAKGSCWVCVSHARGASGHILYSRQNGTATTLHRIVFELAVGKEMPEELFACHKCDVPFCVNPAHIFPGTAKDNSRDMVAKNRNYKVSGENNLHAKLKLKDVWDIRLRHRLGGEKQVDLSLEYDVSQETICNLVNFKTWKGR